MLSEFEAPVPLLPEIIALHGKWRSTREALVCGEERLNWGEFCAGNHRFANALRSAGVGRGDRVGIVMSNGLPMVQALFGTLAAGAVSVPINLSVSDEAMLAMLRDAGVSALVVTADQQARVLPVAAALGDALRLCVTDDFDAPGGWVNLQDACRGQPDTLPAIQLAPDDPLNIIYSSGTTGLPKGILHSQRTRRDWAYDLAIALRYHGGARTLLTIGLYSNISWVAMLCTVLAGGTLVVHPRFDARAFLDTVAAERITHTAMVPIQYQRVVEAIDSRRDALASMQSMMSCGSPLRDALKREIFEYFPCGIIELYGLTEGIITTLDPEDVEGRWNSVGRPLIGTDLCILDEDGNQLGPDVPGEIASRGRITMPGYWQREEASREASYTDSEGRQWLRSGDIGYIDREGFLYIVDRKKDMILSGGQNIYPQDLEAVLAQHPAVDDVAVIGIPSARWGETPLALVVPASGAAAPGEGVSAAHSAAAGSFDTVDAESLLDWANARLGRQQRLSELRFVDSLPRNPNGKILKRELRAEYSEQGDD